jgi:PPK2 family polyphosphate:nucleotide phosphotransferase
MNWRKYVVEPKQKWNLSTVPTGFDQPDADKKVLKAEFRELTKKISKWQSRLFAENEQSLLIILQGMDSSGKDGTIKRIMGGVNPQGVMVYSFKHPSDLELEHNYLWRHAEKLPERGQITIFNRSHYENVLIAKVHPELVLAEKLSKVDSVEDVNERFWKRRYKQINAFEKSVIQNGTQVLKFFLHLSKDEQRIRFLDRIEKKEKHWKFSSGDIAERGFWPEYQKAYEEMLEYTSPKLAPWYIIPADDKLQAHLLVAQIILEKLKSMDPTFPPVDKKEQALMDKAKEQLLKE